MSVQQTPSRPALPHEMPTWRDNYHYVLANIRAQMQQKRPLTAHDATLFEYFSQDSRRLADDVTILTDYFTAAFAHYATDGYARAYYPGLPSILGRDSDSIEGCARNLPLLAVLVNRNEGNIEVHCEQLRQAFLNATNPKHRGYWGKLKSYHQTVCEAADFALALWLSRQQVWLHFHVDEQAQILHWLRGIEQVQTVNNNWHLFVVLVQLVIRALSGEGEVSQERYEMVKSFYVGEGWFRDGPTGNFDYYNSWGFHYPLFWIDQIAPDFDRAFIHQAAAAFCENYRYLFTPQGFPFFGRSAPYRLAAPAALVSSAIQQGQANGQTSRIVKAVNAHFIRYGAIRGGCLTQGLYQADRRLLDPYSGSASPLWALRVLILLNYSHHFQWDSVPEMPMEVEKADFDILVASVPLRIIGSQSSLETSVVFLHNEYPQVSPLERHLLSQNSWQQLKERILGRSTRPKNNLIRKGVTTYSSQNTLFVK